MLTFFDEEFGEIKVKRSAFTYKISAKIDTDGRISILANKTVSEKTIKKILDEFRPKLRPHFQKTNQKIYQNGEKIGKNHKICVVKTGMVNELKIEVKKENILVYLPHNLDIENASVQRELRDEIIKILRKEAKQFLPKKLENFAKKFGFSYQKVRFSHAGSRWGSCSSSGTISLNIALMKLPDELIDYVLIHELCHTRQMNHSEKFWAEVAKYDPNYKLHKKILKKHTPIV